MTSTQPQIARSSDGASSLVFSVQGRVVERSTSRRRPEVFVAIAGMYPGCRLNLLNSISAWFLTATRCAPGTFGATPAASGRKNTPSPQSHDSCYLWKLLSQPLYACAGCGWLCCMHLATVLLHRISRLNDHMVQKLPFSYDYAGDRMLPLETSYVRENCRAKTTSQGWENSVSHYLLIRPGMVTCTCFYTRTTETIASAQQRDIEPACTLIACLVVPAGIGRLV